MNTNQENTNVEACSAIAANQRRLVDARAAELESAANDINCNSVWLAKWLRQRAKAVRGSGCIAVGE